MGVSKAGVLFKHGISVSNCIKCARSSTPHAHPYAFSAGVIALTIVCMILLQVLIQASFDWIRDLLAELLSRCIGAFVANRRKHTRAKSGKARHREISKPPAETIH